VKVLPPVDTDGYSLDQARDLQRTVRARIIAQIAEWRGGTPEEADALADTDAAATDWLNGASSGEGEASVKPSAADGSAEPGA